MKLDKTYFITGISTDVGKTIFSAILTNALQASYWKPIQCGDLHAPDSSQISKLVPNVNIIPSAYSFSHPISPHAAARLENVTIFLDPIIRQKRTGPTVIEGAGGALVPLNDSEDIIDIAFITQAEIILVVKYYLGCINHTLLTLNELKRRHFKVKGLVFNGTPDIESKSIILKRSRLPCLLDILPEDSFCHETVERYSITLKERLNEL